ncbi:type IV secretory system conjugative DNA transfer family protein [Coprococcus comes]|nr:TraG/TraD/VirD4 family protein [Coprococcus comes]
MVNFIFDEFANIGTIPDIEQTIAVTRSRNIGISIILQSVAQLESRYDKKAKTIIDCCDTTLFLGGKSNSTNKEISEMIGKQTINQKTFGETRGQSGSSSKNIQIQGRDLIDAAEIGKMNRREAILLIAGTNPLKDLKYPVEQHPNYIYLDPGRNKPGQVKNRCLYDEPFDILEYMDEIRTKDATYAS